MPSPPYDIDFEEKATIKFHIRKFLLYPPFWTDAANQLGIALTWTRVKFDAANLALIAASSGVYCFLVEPSFPDFIETRYLFYTGRTTRTLQVRFTEYLDDQQGKGKPRPKVFEMLKVYDGHLYFYFAPIPNAAQIVDVEEKLLNTFVPHINTAIPKVKIKPELSNIYE